MESGDDVAHQEWKRVRGGCGRAGGGLGWGEYDSWRLGEGMAGEKLKRLEEEKGIVIRFVIGHR